MLKSEKWHPMWRVKDTHLEELEKSEAMPLGLGIFVIF